MSLRQFVSLGSLLLASLLSLPALAQAPRPALDSPEIAPDRHVTFRLRAPQATKVELSGQFLKANQPMEKDASGDWSVTVGPVEPNLYPYHFVVDGLNVADPGNPALFPNERFKSSLIDIPGEVLGQNPPLHAVQDVPHGELHYGYFQSKVLGTTRPYVVYTPPGYDKSKAKYPVLYLVSGTTDTEETWYRAGRANFILDNLIAQKKAVPMIVVMPYGYMMRGTFPRNSAQAGELLPLFADELVHSLRPHIEAHYRTLPGREHRAIAGFSRGGTQSMFTAFKHADHFAWVASFSSYIPPVVLETQLAEVFSKPEQINARYRLFWLGVGRSDFLYPEAEAFNRMLTDKQIRHTELITEGGHTWMNARHYLIETLQRFFK